VALLAIADGDGQGDRRLYLTDAVRIGWWQIAAGGSLSPLVLWLFFKHATSLADRGLDSRQHA
jgi:hypothetical protein